MSRIARDAAQMIAWIDAIEPYTGPVDPPYDGPEPQQEYLTGREADRAADRYWDAVNRGAA